MCNSSSWWMRSSSLSPGGLASSLARRAPTRSSSSSASGVPGSGGPRRLFHSPASHSRQLVGAAIALAVSRVSRGLGTSGCSTDSAKAEGDSSSRGAARGKGASPPAAAALPAVRAHRVAASCASNLLFPVFPARGASVPGTSATPPLSPPNHPALHPCPSVWECMQVTCRRSQERAFEEGHRERAGGLMTVCHAVSQVAQGLCGGRLPRRQTRKEGLYAVQCGPAGTPGRPWGSAWRLEGAVLG